SLETSSRGTPYCKMSTAKVSRSRCESMWPSHGIRCNIFKPMRGLVSCRRFAISDEAQIVEQTWSPVACTVFLCRDGVMTDLNTVLSARSTCSTGQNQFHRGDRRAG